MNWIVVYRYNDEDTIDDYECEICSNMELINLLSNENIHILKIVRSHV